jgi:glutamate-1-semialdehyde aminotransferase
MAAIIGTRDVMEAAQGSFISSTYWTEKIGPAAALATIKKHRALNVPRHLNAVGTLVQQGWREAADATGLDITIAGLPPLTFLTFNYPNAQAIRTLYTQIMLERGYLATNAYYATYAHKPARIAEFMGHVGEAFEFLSGAIAKDEVEKQLKGPIAHAGFQRLT